MNPIFFSKAFNAIRGHLKDRPTLKLVSINSGWLIGDKLLRLFIGLFVSAWVARFLGPDQYGKLAYVIAFLAMFHVFSRLGLDSIIVRDIAKELGIANQVLGTAFRLRLCASAFSFAAACLAIYVIFPKNIEYNLLVITIGFGIVFQTADIVDLWFQSQSQSRRTVIAKVISYVIAAAVKVVLIVTGAPLWLFAAAIGGETALSAVALYISYKKYPVSRRWAWNTVVAREMLHQSYPLLLSGMSIIIYMKSSQLIINALEGSVAVGIYSSAQLLSELWYFLPMTIVASVAPVIARKKSESEMVYTAALQNVFGLMWLISLSISVVIAVSSGLIVKVLFGDAYSGAAVILSIHIFSLIPVCIGVTQSLWLINENKSFLALYQALAGAISSIGLNFLLISKYGIVGGAIATVVSQFIQAFLVNALLAPSLFRIQVKSLIELMSQIWHFSSSIVIKRIV